MRLLLTLLVFAAGHLCVNGLAIAAMRNVDIGDTVGAAVLRSLDGVPQVVSFDTPTVVVFWASWSPRSLAAIDDLVKAAPQGGVRWRVLPINVDSPGLDLDSGGVAATARTAGWNGSVLIDSRYELFNEWGVIAVPTIVVVELGGIVADVEHTWDSNLRNRIVTTYFGAITDSVPGIFIDPASEHCLVRAQQARDLWRQGQHAAAISTLSETLDSCEGVPRDAARLALWAWEIRDTVLALQSAKALETRPAGAWGAAVHSALAAHREDWDHAAEFASTSLASDSTFTPAWTLLAGARHRLGDSTAAIDAWQRGVRLNKHDPELLWIGSQIELSRGRALQAARLYRKAVEGRLLTRRSNASQ